MNTDPEIIVAPWDVVVVARLNAFQKRGGMHPFTCGNDTRDILVATTEGWVCRNCDYTQDWALAFMPEIGMRHIAAEDYTEALEEIEWPEPEPFVHLLGCVGGPVMRTFGGEESCLWCQACNTAWNLALDAAAKAASECFWPTDGSWVTDQTTFDNLGHGVVRSIEALKEVKSA